ncbi:MAG: polysaccharide deacetylase [Methylocystis sp.]|nr:polysaccharide deacetylase [Methylocystis sp.]
MSRSLFRFALCASLAAAATARAESCAPPPAPSYAAGADRVRDYAPIFESCVNDAGETRLATRRMTIDGVASLLVVDPRSLKTSLQRAACWRCAETNDAAQGDTRFLRALAPADDDRPPALVNAGLIHGKGGGAFVTGDLCPTPKPLDRAFLEKLAALGPRAPVTLAVSGAWIARHRADFEWLQAQRNSGALAIAWANHSYTHPYVAGLTDSKNYLLRPGVDIDREIFEPEKLLIANGETPSVFFRFPGLVADAALLEKLRARHLVALGADAWLAMGPQPKPGSIILVHPNGNEPAGLKIFTRLMDGGKIPQPLRPIDEAP